MLLSGAWRPDPPDRRLDRLQSPCRQVAASVIRRYTVSVWRRAAASGTEGRNPPTRPGLVSGTYTPYQREGIDIS